MIPPRMQNKMTGTTSINEGVLAKFLMPILPKIGGEPMREALVKLHWLISSNTASVEWNLEGGWHRNLVLTMTMEDYM